MGKINILDKHVAELIAAGEVVERPSSVVKELLENSIDAGADAVTVEIQNGGVTYIRITDNGSGIEKDDIRKAFIRHATSKIKLEDDLDGIGTLGFRGEALASIAAVSNVELLTRFEKEEIGHRYVLSGGEEVVLEEAGCPHGTTIIVRDLFFNTPARMKFLKKDVAEGNAVAGVVDKIALSHPEVSVTFLRNGKQVLKTPGDNSLKSVIYSVYGAELAKGLIPVDYEYNGIHISGFLSKPENARSSRAMQSFFLNGRYVKSRTAAAALDEAGKGNLMVGKHFAAFLNIEIPFALVDVNVHPAKIEVRFTDERPVFSAVYHAVKSALASGDTTKNVTFAQKERKKSTENPFAVFEHYDAVKKNDIAKTSQTPQTPLLFNKKGLKDDAGVEIPPSTVFLNKNSDSSFDSVSTLSDAGGIKSKVINVTKTDSGSYFIEKNSVYENKDINKHEENQSERFNADTGADTIMQAAKSAEKLTPLDNGQGEPIYIGQAFDTYIIMQQDAENLLFIDKHAAHERLIYEKLKKEKGKGYAQLLLKPEKITLTKEEYNALLENKDILLEAGFEVDDFGMGTVVVRSLPSFLDNTLLEETIVEIAKHLLENRQDVSTEHMDWIYHNISCRSAIKGGDISHSSELIALTKQLLQNPEIRYCPHGRPIIISITKKEIEKLFGRV